MKIETQIFRSIDYYDDEDLIQITDDFSTGYSSPFGRNGWVTDKNGQRIYIFQKGKQLRGNDKSRAAEEMLSQRSLTHEKIKVIQNGKYKFQLDSETKKLIKKLIK